jgi:hypothetical protein
MCYASSVHVSAAAHNMLLPCMNNSQQKQPSLLCSCIFIHANCILCKIMHSSTSLFFILHLSSSLHSYLTMFFSVLHGHVELCLIIMETLLWNSSIMLILFTLNATRSQLRFSSLAVTVFDIFPSVNCLYDESSFHWQLPRDSSAPLAITLRFFEFSGRCNQSFSAVTISLSLAVTERTSMHSCLWCLFPS